MRRRTVQLEPVYGPCSLAADTIDTERRTIEVVFLSGQPIARTPLFSDSYWLEFDLTAKAADLSRLNEGAAVLDSHNHFGGVAGVLGKVERAWLAGGKARAQLRFSKRAEVDGVWQDVADGILTSISAGVYLEEMSELEKEKGSDMRRFRVTKWQPYELSVVGVPADAGAKIQASADLERRPCRLTLLSASEAPMNDIDTDTTTDIDTDDGDQPAAKSPAELRRENRELRRQAEAHRLAAHFELGDLQARRWIDSGASKEDMIRAGSAERARRAPPVENDIGFGNDWDSPGSRVEMMAEGLAARAARAAPSGLGRRYADSTLAEIALECLKFTGHHRGLDVRRHAGRAVELALHTGSDFPLILGNVLNKRALPMYESSAQTFKLIAAQVPFADFRPERFIRAGDFPVPLETNEHGEISHGTMSENQELVSAVTYARILGLDRRVLVNDDMGAFERMAASAAQRVADLHNATFYSRCILAGSGLGPTLSDSLTVYHATHANTLSAGALSNTLLGEALSKMMQQTSKDGIKLNIMPRFLLVPPGSVVTAKTLLTQIQATQASNVNPFAGDLIAVGDANLSGTRFYVLADPGRIAQYVYGWLADGPIRFDTRAGWEVEGVDFRVVTDFGCGAVESRAGCTGAGA